MEFPTTVESLAYEAAMCWARENASGKDPAAFGAQVAAVRTAVIDARAQPKKETATPEPKPEASKKDAAAPTGKPQAAQSSPAAGSESPASKDATGDAQTPPTADTGSDPEVTYDQVAAAFLKTVKVDRPKAMGALERRKIASVRALKPEEYADFIAEMQA